MKTYSQDELYNAHHQSMFNKIKLQESTSKLCGCFNCKDYVSISEITEWTDNNRTAICPYCGIDSIISDTEKFPLTKSLLQQLYKRYFDYSSEV